MKIGVFDSGVGGLSVANALKQAFPEDEIIYKNDKAHVPYGTKTKDQLLEFVPPILNELVKSGCQLIVIACNTVSTTIINELKQIIHVPLITMEPMVEAAVLLSKSKIIAICATPATLASERYADLKKQFAQGVKVLEPDCSDWATMIENNEIDHSKISSTINQVCREGADVIVFGCTHYHWVENLVRVAAGDRAVIIQPEIFIIQKVKQAMLQFA